MKAADLIVESIKVLFNIFTSRYIGVLFGLVLVDFPVELS